jgi:hypothetical protein
VLSLRLQDAGKYRHMTIDELRACMETINQIDMPQTMTWTTDYALVAQVFGADAARELRKDLEERGEGRIGDIHFRLMQ